MKTAFVIQIIQPGQYGFFLGLADFDPANIGVLDCLWNLHTINDEIETLCHCRLMR